MEGRNQTHSVKPPYRYGLILARRRSACTEMDEWHPSAIFVKFVMFVDWFCKDANTVVDGGKCSSNCSLFRSCCPRNLAQCYWLAAKSGLMTFQFWFLQGEIAKRRLQQKAWLPMESFESLYLCNVFRSSSHFSCYLGYAAFRFGLSLRTSATRTVCRDSFLRRVQLARTVAPG